MASKESTTRFHPYNKKPKPKARESSSSSGLSVNDLKRRIRDVKRLLNHADLSPEARIVQERALAGYEKDLQDELERRKRSEMIKRYHFVRFLDRKAATKELRRLTQQQTDMEASGADAASLEAIQQKVHIAQINVNYTIYYPLSEKYIALHPQDKKKKTPGGGESDNGTKEDDDDDDGDNVERTKSRDHPHGKPPMWDIVERCTAQGTLGQLRDGKLNIGFDGKQKATTKAESVSGRHETKKSGSGQKETRQKSGQRHAKRHDSGADAVDQRDGEGDESDGGFFEA